MKYLSKFLISVEEYAFKHYLVAFVVLCLIEGLVFASLVPISRVPDDGTHFHQMHTSLGVTGYEKAYNDFVLNSSVGEVSATNYNKVDFDKYIDVGMESNDYSLSIIGMPHLSIIKYLPASIGLLIGSLFHMPMLMMFEFSRLLSLAFFIGMGVLILKVMPIKKHIMFFCLMLPMSIQQCSSINPDAVLIPCSFLFVALIFKYYYEDNIIGWKEGCVLLMLLAIIAICKIVYVFMGLFVFIIPLSKISLKVGRIELVDYIKKYRPLLICGMIIMLVGAVFLLRDNYFVKILIASALEPARSCKLIFNTIPIWRTFYFLSFVGNFGALDISVGKKFVLMFLSMCIVVTFVHFRSKEEEYTIAISKRIYIIAVALIVCIFIFISMFSWSFYLADFPTDVSISQIRADLFIIDQALGVQGRYFIPIFPMVLLAISCNIKKVPVFFTRWIHMGYYPVAIFYITKVLLYRYWI